MNKYLDKIDKVFTICCTDDSGRINIANYMKNRLFGDFCEIRYTAKFKRPEINIESLFDKHEDLKALSDDTWWGTYNCAREHYLTIKQAYNRGFETIMICEDDFRVEPDNEEEFKNAITQLPDDFDIVKMYSHNNTLISDDNTDFELYNDYYYKFVEDSNNYSSTICIIYSRKGMEYMMKWYEEEFMPFDRYFNRICTEKFNEAIINNELKVYHLIPVYLILEPYDSQITYNKSSS